MSKPILTPDELQQKFPPPSVTAIIDALKAKQITVVAQKVWDQDGDYMSTCTFARDGKEASGCFHVGSDGNEAHSVEYFTFRGFMKLYFELAVHSRFTTTEADVGVLVERFAAAAERHLA